jgi:two-component sensor histidine kinase
MRLAKVKIAEYPYEVLIPISSLDKPEISEEQQNKWQKILNLAAQIIGVPSGLITKTHENQLEVYLTSETEGNIFAANIKLDLGLGWYCENTIGERHELIIENALKMDKWKDNPSIPFNMISYMGIPIFWPDGEVFGTFCMLDKKENMYSKLYLDLLLSLVEIIQNDLKSEMTYLQSRKDLKNRENQLREVNHLIKNHFNLLIATIRLQSFQKNDHDSIESILKDIEARILTISIIHDNLSKTINLDKVLLCEYLTELGKHIIQNSTRENIIFNTACDTIFLKPELSVPCGLILNELITNSLKYAFENIEFPAISLKIELKNEKEIVIIYKDNGVGLNESIDIDKAKTLGLNFIKNSIIQLKGEYLVKNENGFLFQMKFKVSK